MDLGSEYTGDAMNLPWVSRKTLEAHTLQAESALEVHKVLSAAALERANLAVDLAQNELAEAKADNKLLIDRVLQTVGQPPLFHPQAIAPQLQPVSDLPGPATRTSFDDVHKAYHEARRSGTLNLMADK